MTACRRSPAPPDESDGEPDRAQRGDPSPSEKSVFDFEVVTVNHQGTVVDRRPGRAEVRREALEGGVELEMVGIPGGTFVMGSPEGEEGRDWYLTVDESLTNVEGPQREVTVPSFWIGKYAVTQAQWRAVASYDRIERDLKPDPSYFKGDNRPVEGVSWENATEFCQRLSAKTGRGYRLPSEAEWEYACRAGTETPFHFGDTITTELANYRGEDVERSGVVYPGYYGSGPRGTFRTETTDVGSFPPNEFGLYDMHGNVSEWCADWWHESYAGAPSSGTPWIEEGDSRYRVLRGGSWDYPPHVSRSAFRDWNHPDIGRYIAYGFRVVCSLE